MTYIYNHMFKLIQLLTRVFYMCQHTVKKYQEIIHSELFFLFDS